MGYSEIDDTLRPMENGWFSHFKEGGELTLTALEESQMYKEDWIGLRTLQESGRLHRFKTRCAHDDYESADCFVPAFMTNVIPFFSIPLNNTN
jgi:palmitoyl-protein thioesterase